MVEKYKFPLLVGITAVAVIVIGLIGLSFNEDLLDDCLNRAYDSYRQDWDRTCRSESKGEDCLLDQSTAERWDGLYKEYREVCFRKYGQ